MKKIKLPAKVTRGFYKVGFGIKKHSPEILIGVGAVGVVASTVLACKATLKVHEKVEHGKKDIATIKEAAAHGCTAYGQDYSEQDAKNDLRIVRIQTGVAVVKAYAPAVLLGAASFGCMFASHKILRGRNVALAAAYASVDKSFKEYRGRVIERFGKELDRELRYDIKAKEVEETVVDEKGNEKTVKTTAQVINHKGTSGYARIWYEGNNGWTKDAEYNHLYLKQLQNYANEQLQAKGHLYLNEVYDMLGFDRSKAGQIMGWVYDPTGNGPGDNYVDFGIDDITDENKIAFVNGKERSIVLDFNVVNIYDAMA